MVLANWYVGLPISFAYSLVISFFVLYYFLDMNKTNKFLFIIGIVHLSSLFLMPIMCFTLVLLPTRNVPVVDYNDLVYRRIINIISYTNHVLNKLVYPMVKIYCSSGYISIFHKIFHISLKELFLDLFGIWYSIFLIIIYFIFKNFYDNTFQFLLNYLNILDLLTFYFEIGFSLGSINVLYKKAFGNRKEYEDFLLGKISIYKQKKELISEFSKNYKEVYKYYSLYNSKFQNLDEINNFMKELNNTKYSGDFRKEELELNKSEQPIDQNMTQKKLENLISKPYKLCKKYLRKLDRFQNLKNELLGRTNEIKKDSNCCTRCINKCTSYKKCYFIFYIILCVIIIFAEYSSPMLEVENYRDTTAEYESVGKKKSFNYLEIILMLLAYPVVFVGLFISISLYILPLSYSLIYRKIVTGDFFYANYSSDTIDLVESLGKITEKVCPCLYVSSFFYGYVYFSTREENFDINTLYFFEIPYSNIILFGKDAYVLICILITKFIEEINIKCFNFEININDECLFDKDGKCCSCCSCCSSYKKRRNEYIEQGKKERGTNNLNIEYQIKQTNETNKFNKTDSDIAITTNN